jgi:DNA processing protein
MTPGERLARIRLARTSGIGPLTFRRLLARYPVAEDAIAALPELAMAGGRVTPPNVTPLATVEKELAQLHRFGGRMLVLGEPDYPANLAMLEDAPPVLSMLGDPALLRQRAVGLVGARNASANGQRMAEALAAELASHAVLIVSGLARGIDTAAHTGALHTGHTAAAIAGGLDVPYPPENAALQARIAEKGVVLAEAPLGTAPQARHFPRRNRIIAGLSLGVVVVEAARNSGSLITAQQALDAHRVVLAVPGSPLDPRCHGSNDLIRAGAILVGQASDVLEGLADWHPVPLPLPLGFAEPEAGWNGPEPDGKQATAAVLALLGADATDVDDLIRRCHLSASAVMSALFVLELDGVVETLPGHRVALVA